MTADYPQPLTATLRDGLRIVHLPTQSAVGYFGVAVRAGSRDDGDTPGIAHFVEHTIFKGTRRRRSYHIINRMEWVGGELNAYTSKEDTFVYSIFPSRHYGRAVELIGDLIANSLFPDMELDKEREVVLDEIASYRDIPGEAVYDDFEDLIFAGSGLGHNILGDADALRELHSEQCRHFLERLYRPGNMVVFSAGDYRFEQLCRKVESAISASLSCRAGDAAVGHRRPAAVTPFRRTVNIEAHQAHSIYGVRLFDMYDERRFALSLLNNILGGPGMNSLLNVELRERRGYVYTVESASTLYTDSGLWSVYFGCDEQQLAVCHRLIGRCIERLAAEGLTERQLSLAKRQYVGQLQVAAENMENRALALGKAMLYYGRPTTPADTERRILGIGGEQLRQVAELLTPDNAATLSFV